MANHPIKLLGLLLTLLFNLRRDPYERANITSNTYWDWYIDRSFLLLAAGDYTTKFLVTFEEFPPRQKAGSFTIGDAKAMIYGSMGSK